MCSPSIGELPHYYPLLATINCCKPIYNLRCTNYTEGHQNHSERAIMTIKSRAAVAFAANQPLQIVEVDVEAPKAGEVLVRIVASGVCHTDAFTLPAMIRKASSRPYSAMKAVASSKRSVKALLRWRLAIT